MRFVKFDVLSNPRGVTDSQMRAWVEEGLIGTDQGYVVIRRPEVLEQLAGCVVA